MTYVVSGFSRTVIRFSRTVGVVLFVGLVLSAAVSAQSENEVTIRRPFANPPELIIKHGVPQGTMHRFTMKSEDSTIYKGVARNQPGAVVPYERQVAVYVPAQYVPGTPAPFIVVQDGYNPKYQFTVPAILDNLIHEKRLPAMIAVMIHHGGGDGPGSQRGLEYDTVSDTYTMFVETEVLPRIERDYKVRFTKDPEGRATLGGSSGAACALTMAWFHPELYAWEYHATMIPNTERKPIRIWLEVGQHDNGVTREESSFRNWVLANQRMAAVLKAKGYQYKYVFAEDAGHTDANVIFQTLPGALEWLWQGYPK